MKTTTLKFTVFGSDHNEIVLEIEKELEIFLNGEDKKISYEIEVQKANKSETPQAYSASVIARVKNGY